MNLSKLLPKLSRRESALAYAVAGTIFLLLLDKLVLNQILGDLETIKTDSAERQHELRRYRKIVENRARIERSYKRYEGYISTGLSDVDESADLMKELSELTTQAGVTVEKFSPQKDSAPIEVGKQYLIDLNVETTMERLLGLVHSLYSSKRLLRIEHLSLQAVDKKPGTLKVSLKIAKTVIRP